MITDTDVPLSGFEDNDDDEYDANNNAISLGHIETNRRRVVINRPAYLHKQFDNEFGIKRADKWSLTKFVCQTVSKFNPLLEILRTFTIIDWISQYDLKSCFIADLFSGLTVGIFHVPASLAYGALTSLNPVHGLYTAFYTGLVYVLFGTSKHLSVGTFAITSMMVFSTVNRIESEYFESQSNSHYLKSFFTPHNQTFNDMGTNVESVKIKIATGLAFWCGVIQILFSMFRLGGVSKYLSQPLLRGFTTAAAIYVLTTQVKHMFGIYTNSKSNKRQMFKLIFTYMDLVKNIELVNWCSLAISTISILFLIIARIHVNERFKKQLRNVPIPIEFIVIIVGTLASYYGKLNERFHVAIVGHIPSGIVLPSLPEFSLFFSLIHDAVIISVVAFACSISVSDLLARKHKYKINSNRELFALGMANVVGSFFQSFVSCGALSRTMVLESSGGKTQLVTVIASFVVLSVMLWFSVLLEALPKACLGAIIIAALVNLLKQVQDIPHYWRLDKLDFIVWMVTFTCGVLIDLDYGLVIGLATVLFINTYRNRDLHLDIVGRVRNYETHVDATKYAAVEYSHVRIVRPDVSLFYINSDSFHAKLNDLCPLKSTSPTGLLDGNCMENLSCAKCMPDISDLGEDASYTTDTRKNTRYRVILIDMQLVQFVDESGCNCLRDIVKEYSVDGVRVLLANCSPKVIEFFKKADCYYSELDELIFLSIEDAIQCLN